MTHSSHPFIIYDASAGSGKTFTLAGNYISELLLSNESVPYRSMLAITFTNKAVAEMKSRIIESLWAFAQQETPETSMALFRYVKEQTNLPDQAIREKSQAVLKSILHNYAGFEVSTIDSFNQRILRTFAKDLNIPLNFEVELDTEEILQEAVDRLIAKVGKDKSLTKTLIDFAFFKADDDKSWDIGKDLNDIAKLLTNENNFAYLQRLRGKSLEEFADFQKELNRKITELKASSVKTADEFFSLLDQYELDFKDFNRGSLPNFLKKVKDRRFPYPSDSKWQKALKEGDTIYPKKISAAKAGSIDKLQPQFAKLYTDVENNLFRIDFLKKVRQKTPALSLLTAIEKEVSEIKTERGLVLISEFNKTINNSIKNQPAPFIYERLGERYSTYYIDEFQDTSVLQWENMQPLIENTLASGEGKLTLVGDTKQSIYRWRGGKAEQFMTLCAGESPFQVAPETKKLPFNFRSLYQIVQFNNDFFAHAAQILNHPDHQRLFETARQTPNKPEGGFVDIRFIEAKNTEEEKECYPKEVLNILNNLKAPATDGPSEKNRHLNDVCILVRKRDQGVAIADYLSQNDIPIISSETLLLSKSEPVNFIVSLLKYALNPFDDEAKFDLLNFLYSVYDIGESHYEFLKERLDHHGQSFFDTLETHGPVFNLDRFKSLPLYSAILYGIRIFKLQSSNAYVQFFLDFVYEYTQSQSGGIPGLLDLWDLKKDKLSIAAPEGQNAVQIMTIHKAKGLQFRVVIFPFANEKIDDTQHDDIWVELENPPNAIPVAYLNAGKKLNDLGGRVASAYQTLLNHTELDVMNLNYVAMTRPEEQLYILSKYDVDKNGHEKPTRMSGMLISYLKATNEWEDNQLHYQIGTKPPLREVPDIKHPVETLVLEDVPSAPQNQALKVVTKSGEQWGSPQEKAIEEGTIIHDLLKDVYHPEDIASVIEKAIINGRFLKNEGDYYTQLLSKVVRHSDLAPYFSKDYTVYTEKELITKHELIRLDRLCIDGEEAVIIDYKSGAPKAGHQTQINRYAAAVEAMDFQVVEKILVYLAQDALKIDKIT